MYLTRALRGNLNRRHWDRRVWEVGYRGPVLPQQKATGRPDYPVKEDDINILRQRFQREHEVMHLLTKSYISKEVENDYFAMKGVNGLEELRQRHTDDMEARRMPGKEKRTEGSKNAVRRRANIGNLLHSHSTVEDSLSSLINRNRWD